MPLAAGWFIRPLSKLKFIPDFSTPGDKSPGWKLKPAEAGYLDNSRLQLIALKFISGRPTVVNYTPSNVFAFPEYFKHPATSSNVVGLNNAFEVKTIPLPIFRMINSYPTSHLWARRISSGRTICP